MVAINYDAEPGRPDVMTDPLLMALCRGADTAPSRPQPAAGVPVCGRYGPTHSQSLEKLFLGVPHLRVVAGSLVHDPAGVPRALLAQDSLVLLIEHKLLYPLDLLLPAGRRIEGVSPGSPVPPGGSRPVPTRRWPRGDGPFPVLPARY